MLYYYLGVGSVFVIIGITVIISSSTKGASIVWTLLTFISGGAVIGGGFVEFGSANTYFKPEVFGGTLLSLALGMGLGYYIGFKWRIWILNKYPQEAGKLGVIGVFSGSIDFFRSLQEKESKD